MNWPLNDRDLIGIVLHLQSSEYPKVSEGWKFELPEKYESSLEALLRCRYVGFTVDGNWKSVAEISSWSFDVSDGNRKVAELSRISENIYNLGMTIRTGISDVRWLTTSQADAVQADLGGATCKLRPAVIAACLDFEEASDAVARRYGVNSEQVRISIHRR